MPPNQPPLFTAKPMTLDQAYQFYIQNQQHLPMALAVLAFLVAWSRWSKWKSKALQSSGSAEVIKMLRDDAQQWRTSNTLVMNQREAERKARVDELEVHARNWRRMSDRLLRDGKHQPEESGFSDEALRRIGTFASGDLEAGDWLDEIADEIGVDDQSNYTELVEAIIKARKA